MLDMDLVSSTVDELGQPLESRGGCLVDHGGWVCGAKKREVGLLVDFATEGRDAYTLPADLVLGGLWQAIDIGRRCSVASSTPYDS